MRLDERWKSSLDRLLRDLDFSKLEKSAKDVFLGRLNDNFKALFGHLEVLYGEHQDFHPFLHELLTTLVSVEVSRPRQLKQQDGNRESSPYWYKSQDVVGMAVYVDLFAGDLQGLKEKIPYLQELGITYLHLMPLYKSPEGDNDGGYAVSDYRTVNPQIGSFDDLVELANALRASGIKLVLDFVFNHTSDEHEWAAQALNGKSEYQDFFYFIETEAEVNEYNRTVREIFPQVRRGSFTYIDSVKKWVWTTFNSFQWDLNYSNPHVFNAISREMLFLANAGCDVLRLDALAFIWKEKGTMCESLPKAHTLIKAFNLCLKIAAPSVIFKSEAIVHPDEVAKYISTDECVLSYNPLLMALAWESLATRETKLLNASMFKSFQIPEDCAWVNYLKCHDDIGWTWDDEVSEGVGINGYFHRQFLNQFYTGRFIGSFAQGVPFQENPSTGDCRVCGSLASLAGLEQALIRNNPNLVEHAIKRIIMLNAVNLSMAGIPLLYQGDDLTVLNDYSYVYDPSKNSDGRWVNRKKIEQVDLDRANDPNTPHYIISTALKMMIAIRQSFDVFGRSKTTFLETYNPHAFAFARVHENGQKLLVLANFNEHELQIPHSITDILSTPTIKDLLTGEYLEPSAALKLEAYDVKWLFTEGHTER